MCIRSVSPSVGVGQFVASPWTSPVDSLPPVEDHARDVVVTKSQLQRRARGHRPLTDATGGQLWTPVDHVLLPQPVNCLGIPILLLREYQDIVGVVPRGILSDLSFLNLPPRMRRLCVSPLLWTTICPVRPYLSRTSEPYCVGLMRRTYVGF